MKNILILISLFTTTICFSQDIEYAGVYYYSDNNTYQHIEPIQYTKTKGKASGMFNGKVKRTYKNVVSKNIVSNNPIFYFSYKKPLEGKKRQYYMFVVSDSPTDIVLSPLVQKRETRELVISKVNSLTGSVVTANNLHLNSSIEKVSDDLFKISFNQLEDGEYCFMLYDPSGAFADGYVFDFSVGGKNLKTEKEQKMKDKKKEMYFDL